MCIHYHVPNTIRPPLAPGGIVTIANFIPAGSVWIHNDLSLRMTILTENFHGGCHILTLVNHIRLSPLWIEVILFFLKKLFYKTYKSRTGVSSYNSVLAKPANMFLRAPLVVQTSCGVSRRDVINPIEYRTASIPCCALSKILLNITHKGA